MVRRKFALQKFREEHACLGLGYVKIRAVAARVVYLGGIARRESQIMLRPFPHDNGLENCIFHIPPMYELSPGSIATEAAKVRRARMSASASIPTERSYGREM